MKDKYSLAKCEQYGRRLAARLCEQHFGSQPTATLDGPAVLRFTPVRQVNLLVVHQLLGQWQGEMSRLRSPYFDFAAPAVQTALTQFMNVLSRHIHLERQAFEPLLAQAVADTLRVVADPAATFEHLLLGNAPEPTAAQLREGLRYLDIDKAFYEGFIDSLPSTGPLTRDFLTQRFGRYHEANYRAHQPMQRLVEAFSPLLPLTEADLREDGPVSAATPTTPPAPVAERPAAPAPVAPSPVTPPTPAAPAAPAVTIPTFAPPTPTPVATPAPAAPAPTLAPESNAPAPAAPDSAPEVPLYEKLKATQPNPNPLAETLRTAAVPLAERTAPKVESLREAISINQRFSFINELFNGENAEYHAVIQHLDSLPSGDDARRYVTQDLSARYDWSRKEEHVGKLLKLIERRFA